jgi:hypothetical protein
MAPPTCPRCDGSGLEDLYGCCTRCDAHAASLAAAGRTPPCRDCDGSGLAECADDASEAA